MEEKYLICEDSLEGIFTGVYDAYALREGHEHIHIQIGEEDNLKLFAVYQNISPDLVKTRKVIGTIERRLGTDIYIEFCKALATEDADKGQAVYQTIVDAITRGSGRNVLQHLTNPFVGKTVTLARKANNEINRLIEFVRFQELEQKILFSKIGPVCNVVSFLMPHFADRFPLENFIVYDEKRGIFGVHPARKEWYLVTGTEIALEKQFKYSPEEESYRDLFTMFCRTIAIKERKNLKLQQQMVPLRFQDYMVEFAQK